MKPVRLEIRTADRGPAPWRKIGAFNAADEHAGHRVMQAAAQLAEALNDVKRSLAPTSPPRRLACLRVCRDDGLAEPIVYWTALRGWHDAREQESA